MTVLRLLVVFLLISPSILANSGGVSRRAVLTSSGCGPNSCHGGVANAATVVRVVGLADGADLRVQAGQTIDITIVVANALAVASGVNIAVKSDINATSNAGTLAPKTGGGLTRLNNELTHSTPKTFSNGIVEFPFTWTAPQEPDTTYLHAIANAVNRNGRPDNGDQWNWMQPVRLIVEPVASVASDDRMSTHQLNLSPLPSHGDVHITIPEAVRGDVFAMYVIDATGTVVQRSTIRTEHTHIVTWNGRTTDGAHAPNGSYVVVLHGDRTILRGRAIIQR